MINYKISYSLLRTAIFQKAKNHIVANQLSVNPVFYFCNNRSGKNKQASQLKIEQVSFISQSILDIKKLSYNPKRPLNFVNGKYLVYKNHRSIFQILLRSLPYLVAIFGFAYICYTNPFANTFPAAGPIFLMIDILIIWLFVRRFKRNQNLVKQIYLLQNGSVTQIHYANALKRRLFGESQSKMYYNSIFVNPQNQLEQEQLQMHKGNIFPTEKTKNTEQSQKKSGYAWIKYYANGQNYFLIPKKAQQCDTQVLIAIFEGKVIVNQK